MRKKLMMACIAIAAFAAFVVAPPSASAVTLTQGTEGVSAGFSLTGRSTELKFTASGNTVTCTSADIGGTVTSNSFGTLAAEFSAGTGVFTGTSSGGDCTSEGLGPVKPTVNSKLCLHVAKGTDTGTLTGCEGHPITLTLNVTNLGLLCRYEAISVIGNITTAPADAAVNVSEQTFAGEAPNSIFCPGSGKLDMELTFTATGGGTTLTFN